jgi:hypothetical protein
VKPSTFLARVTTDRIKLWSCEEMRRTNPANRVADKPLPQNSGTKICLEAPALSRAELLRIVPTAHPCQSKKFWVFARIQPNSQNPEWAASCVGMWVCEHQIDFESIAT